MNLTTSFTFFGHNPIFILIVEHPLHFGIAKRAIDGLEQTSFFKVQTSTYFIIPLVDPVTDHAGNALTRGRMTF